MSFPQDPAEAEYYETCRQIIMMLNCSSLMLCLFTCVAVVIYNIYKTNDRVPVKTSIGMIALGLCGPWSVFLFYGLLYGLLNIARQHIS